MLLAYLVRLFIWALLAALVAALTATQTAWPLYGLGCLFLAFMPGDVMIEIIPDILEALADVDFD